MELVIGGGITGLCAANRLVENKEVTLIEKSGTWGGLSASYRWQGCRLDLGPHRIYSDLPNFHEFISDLFPSGLITVKRESRMLLRNKYVDYPISPKQVLDLYGWTIPIKGVLSYILNRVTRLSEPVSYQDYLLKNFGSVLYKLLFADYAAKVWRTDLKEIGADLAKHRLANPSLYHIIKNSFAEKPENTFTSFTYPVGGFGVIAEKLADRVNKNNGKLLTNTSAIILKHQSGKVDRVIVGTPEGEKSIQVDGVINTIALPRLINMLEPCAPIDVQQAAMGLTYSGLILVFLIFDDGPMSSDTWLYYPEPEFRISRLTELTNFDPGLAPDEKSLVCVEMPARTDEGIWSSPDGDIYQQVTSDLYRAGFGEALERVRACLVLRFPEVYPVYPLDYRERLERIFNYLESISNLVTAGRGGLFQYINIDHAWEMGVLAAETRINSPNLSFPWYRALDKFANYRIVD